MFFHMINLSHETEALARRVAAANSLPVDETIREALQAFERGVVLLPEPPKPRDLSPPPPSRREERAWIGS